MPHKISIVIRCYNEELHIDHLLSGIVQQSVSDIEIVVVDSGSTDGTVAIASAYPVKIIQIEPDHFSFGRSLNIGCQESKGEYIVIASAHVYPTYSDWLEQLLSPFKDPKIALTYGKQRGNKTTQFSELRVFEKWFPEESYNRQLTPFCNNANAAIRRELWESLPYNEDLTGLEDVAWAKTVIDQGHYLAYVPEAEVIHVHDETPRQTYNRYRREAIAFKQIFPQERFHIWDFMQLWFSNTYSDWRAAKKENALIGNWLHIARFRFVQFLGTYRGYSQQRPVSRKLRQTFYYPNRETPIIEDGELSDRHHLRIPYDALEEEA